MRPALEPGGQFKCPESRVRQIYYDTQQKYDKESLTFPWNCQIFIWYHGRVTKFCRNFTKTGHSGGHRVRKGQRQGEITMEP